MIFLLWFVACDLPCQDRVSVIAGSSMSWESCDERQDMTVEVLKNGGVLVTCRCAPLSLEQE